MWAPGFKTSHFAFTELVDEYRFRHECQNQVFDNSNPQPEIGCSNVTTITQEIRHNFRLRARFTSQSGGSKSSTINGAHNFPNAKTIKQFDLVFDLEPPIHCTQNVNTGCEYVDQPAIGVYPDTMAVNIHVDANRPYWP